MIIPIPFFDTEISLHPLIVWQSVSTLIAFLVVIFTIHEKSFAWILNIIKKLMNFFIYYSKGLYAKITLDLILIIKSGYALYKWGYQPKKTRIKQNISALTMTELLFFTGLAIIGSLLIGFILNYSYLVWPSLQGQNSYKDGFHTACSIINYYLLAQKKREAWLFSLAGQVVYAYLFATGLEPFAFKYIGYTFLSMRGFYKWHQAYRKNKAQTDLP